MSPSVRTTTRSSCLALAIVAALFPVHAAFAVPVIAVNESDRTPAPEAPSDPAEQARTLDTVRVEGKRTSDPTPTFPATQAAVDRERIEDTINAVDVQDAARYLPSVFLRKRNFGDTQATLATRTWGVNSSARTLVFIDDIPVSALIANNNSIGAPRWGMVPPEAVDHLDMLYGPFSAAYAGNSMGGVLRITTRQPDRTEVTFRQTQALQAFDQYGTRDDYSTRQTSLTAGGRHGALSWFVGANLQDSDSQPLAYITAAHAPTGTAGAFSANNKLGQPANVVGAGGLLQTRMLNLDGMLSYDITPVLRATYLVGYWRNDARSHVDSYLRDADGQPMFGGVAGFASNAYAVDSRHLMQAVSLKTSTQGAFDGSVVVSRYDFLEDRQLSAAAVAAGTELSANGRRADYAGTGWTTFDATGTWRPSGGNGGAHEVSFGTHADEYVLDNPTYDTANRLDPDSVTGLFSAGRGRTRTQALWLQEAWRFAPGWLATAGVRGERWRASDGFNAGGGIAVVQPRASESAFSPKLSVQWNIADDWRVTGSLARAVRFPTVGELYQLVSTGSTFTVPNPDLGPEDVRSGELAFEHALDQGSLRLSLFQENTRDALVSQTAFLPDVAAPVSYVLNVGELRSRGIEFAAQKNNVLFDGLELSGSVTFVDAVILSNDSFASTAGTTSTGKRVPNVPRWRATAVATYRPGEHWTFTLAGRYSGRQYSTLDNTDNTAHVFGAFDKFTVFDARVHYRINDHLAVALGIDNFSNEKYFLYHPFPQRTYVLDFKYSL